MDSDGLPFPASIEHLGLHAGNMAFNSHQVRHFQREPESIVRSKSSLKHATSSFVHNSELQDSFQKKLSL